MPTDTELLDALEHYAWRVWSEDRASGWVVKVDVYGGPVLGEGATVREALGVAMAQIGRIPMDPIDGARRLEGSCLNVGAGPATTCAKCDGSGIEGEVWHFWPDGTPDQELIRCEACDGFGGPHP